MEIYQKRMKNKFIDIKERREIDTHAIKTEKDLFDLKYCIYDVKGACFMISISQLDTERGNNYLMAAFICHNPEKNFFKSILRRFKDMAANIYMSKLFEN